MKSQISSFVIFVKVAIISRLSQVFYGVICSVIISIYPWSLALAQTSIYHPFPDSNAVWGMVSGSWMCPDVYIQDYYVGDTIIGQYMYKIIQESTTDTICGTPHGLGPGFLREDTVARKVYWRIPGMATDTLLYDFTLDVGDTLWGLYGNTGLCTEGVVTVQSIDSVDIGNSYRKRINFSDIGSDPCNSTSIIEGVGSTTGLTSCYFANKSFGIILTCFKVNGDLIYTKPCGAPELAPCGELPLGLSNRQSSAAIRVSPNPSTGQFHFSPQPKQINVYNSQGKLLFRQQGKEVDLSAYPPGVYTAVVWTAKGNSAQRLVVVR